MGLINGLLSVLFGGGRNVLAETVQVFRPGAEADAARAAVAQGAAQGQFAAEFQRAERGGFDRFMDGVNRLPRPAMVLGTFALLTAAMTDPIWFAARMQGLALVPEPLWWLLGAIVSFYFGARHQVKGQEFREAMAGTMARLPQVVENISQLDALSDRLAVQTRDTFDEDARRRDVSQSPSRAIPEPGGAWQTGPNAALRDWIAAR